MNTVQPDSFDFADNAKIVATQVPEGFRLDFLPRHFSRSFMQVEAAVYGHMGRLCSGYDGGYWDFFDLSNGGCYLAPNGGTYVLVAPNDFEATVSANVAGLIATLYAFSHLAFKFETTEVFAEKFHQLRGFALEHQESRVIIAAID